MAAKSERMTILVESDMETRVNQLAAELNISAGELLRRAFESYDPEPGDEQDLRIIARELEDFKERTGSKLDTALMKMAKIQANFDELDATRSAL